MRAFHYLVPGQSPCPLCKPCLQMEALQCFLLVSLYLQLVKSHPVPHLLLLPGKLASPLPQQASGFLPHPKRPQGHQVNYRLGLRVLEKGA